MDRHRPGLRLAAQLDRQPPAALQEAAQGPDRGLGVLAVRRRPRRLREEADAGVHGEEITQEWLYHMGVPVADIPELAANAATCVPVMMPYVTAFSVSYTHLRAHETRHDLVCRL